MSRMRKGVRRASSDLIAETGSESPKDDNATSTAAGAACMVTPPSERDTDRGTRKFTIDRNSIRTYGPFSAEDVVLLAAYASRTENQDAIDICIVQAIGGATRARAGIKLLDFKPFNPIDDRTEITYREEYSGKVKRVTKGMIGIIIELCTRNRTEELEGRLKADVEEYATRGLGALAVAYEELDGDDFEAEGNGFELIGLLAILDPRKDTEADRDENSGVIKGKRSRESIREKTESQSIQRNTPGLSLYLTSDMSHTIGFPFRTPSPGSPLSSYPENSSPSSSNPPPPRTRNALLEGWRECVLPDRNIYYVHSGRQVVTDVDLHDGGLLDAVMTHLGDRNDSPLIPRIQELWLQNTGSRERGFIPLRCLIDHQKRSATFDTLPEVSGDGGDDRLGAECHYWSFMEAHPAHAPIPHDAQAEALAVLTWNLTDQLLSSRRSAPVPFTQEECRELAALIRSFDKDGENGPAPLRAHIISKILLRVVRWRQLHPRPDQPLPVDADFGGAERVSTEPRRPASPEVIHIDHGVLPSRTVFMERQISRRRVEPSRRLEQGKVGSGDGRAQVNQLFPSLFDSRPKSSHQQNAGETPNEVPAIVHGFKASDQSSPSSSLSDVDLHLQLPANPPRSASSTRPLHVQDSRPFHAHGWAECALLDGSIYYVHHTYQVVTDVDLSDERLLDAMMAYLEEYDDVIPPGQELWLRDAGSHGGEFVPLRWLVDHSKRSAAVDLLHGANGDCEPHRTHDGCRDDRLDANYQYWSFMETHPAHTSLPSDAHQDATDALYWASTHGLLPSHHSKTMPFTREECQSLTTLLHSIERRGETPLRTLTVSKILLRVVHWRQTRFRSNQPLPENAGRAGLRGKDDKLARDNRFMLMIGTYTCLATAVALALSITFVQIVGIGAALLFLFLVESNPNIAAIVKYKGDKQFTQEEQTSHQSIALSQANRDPPISTVSLPALYHEVLGTNI